MDRTLAEANFNDFIRESFAAPPWRPESDSIFSKLSLFQLAKAHCEGRGIFVGVIDSDALNAVAFMHRGTEGIGITRGIVEQLQYVLRLVASCMNEPIFDVEQPWDDAKRLTATRFRKGLGDKLHLSNGQLALWDALLDVACLFILHHELGHLESGHIYWLHHGLRKRAALFEQPLDRQTNAARLEVKTDIITALEIDADTDAVTSTLALLDHAPYTTIQMDGPLRILLETNESRYPIVDIAINIVFALFSHRKPSVDSYRGLHPHPDIRGAYCNAGVLAYCDQPDQIKALQSYTRWVASPRLATFYWEMHYVLKGPYHLKRYLDNAKALSGKMYPVIHELWERSKPSWNVCAEYADERRKKRDSARQQGKTEPTPNPDS